MMTNDDRVAEGCLIMMAAALGLVATGLIGAHFGCGLIASGIYLGVCAVVAMFAALS